jgi:hypothetical protein
MSDVIPPELRYTVCPVDDCGETEDLVVQECAPGHAYLFTGGVCGHVVWVMRKTETDVPRETSTEAET